MERPLYFLLLLGVLQFSAFQDGMARQEVEAPQAVDSLYTWLVFSEANLARTLDQARAYGASRLDVYVDTTQSQDAKKYRVLLGLYETREAASRDQVLIPMTVRSGAKIVAVARPLTLFVDPARQTAAKQPPGGEAAVANPDAAVSPPAAKKQNPAREVFVFLDCGACDGDFVRREIDFVNYVVDRADANVHLLVTSENSAGGTRYNLRFIGMGRFAHLSDTLSYSSSDTDTDAERRDGLTRTIRLGLIRYVARTALAGDLLVKLRGGSTQPMLRPEDDAWKFWRFKISMDGTYSAEESIQSYQIGGSLRADRVTDEWKIRFSAKGDYKKSSFDVDDETITSTKRSGSANSFLINSLGRKWSAGVFGSVSTSSYKNTDYSVTFAPALEYTVFPYSQSSNKELRLSYYLNFHHFDYEQVTVFDKAREDVLEHELQVNLEFRQPWGTALSTLSASNYLTDFETSLRDLYKVELYGYVEVRIVRGLSLWVEGTVSRIRDQLYLSKKKARPEDILLGTVSLPTDYQYDVSAGFVFTFGSIFNSIVNPRFGS